MRTIECNRCGATLSAADDGELTDQLASHLESAHGDEVERDRLGQFVADSAYEAMDS